MKLEQIAARLRSELQGLNFGPPVACVYNPLEYAWTPHAEYLRHYGQGQRRFVLLGMNPGPWGMVQTGVPFGDIGMVRDWLRISGHVGQPGIVHPRRPVKGFDCHRGEISGRRLWGWAQTTFAKPELFFRHFFVVNYCPLCFFNVAGENLTPDKLYLGARKALFAFCDKALLDTMRVLEPKLVIGIGRFAESRAREALSGLPISVAGVLHPSGANPRASQDWGGQMKRRLQELGVSI